MASMSESSTFDDFLSSRSVFVSPLTMVDTDTGGNHAADRYDVQKGEVEYQSERGEDSDEDLHWRWTDASADHAHVVDGSEADGVDTVQRDGHGLTETPSLEGRVSSPLDQDVEVTHEHELAVNSTVTPRQEISGGGNPDRNWDDIKSGDESSRARVETPAVSSPPLSASRSFEDQPIRGLAAKVLSLDELIAQGERQMQEAQAKTALAKAPGARRRNAPLHQPSTNDAVVALSPERQPTTSTGTQGAVPPANGQKESKFHDPEATGVLPIMVHQESSHNAKSFPSPAAPGFGRFRESTSGKSVSSVTRSASFATSWSGGDPDQISMGVLPALGGDEQERMEHEACAERDRQEFYDLEMELLEEEMEAKRAEVQHSGEVSGARGNGDGYRDAIGDRQRDPFWNGDEAGYAGGVIGGSIERSSLPEDPRLQAAAGPSLAGPSAWGEVSDQARLLCAAQYADEAEQPQAMRQVGVKAWPARGGEKASEGKRDSFDQQVERGERPPDPGAESGSEPERRDLEYRQRWQPPQDRGYPLGPASDATSSGARRDGLFQGPNRPVSVPPALAPAPARASFEGDDMLGAHERLGEDEFDDERAWGDVVESPDIGMVPAANQIPMDTLPTVTQTDGKTREVGGNTGGQGSDSIGGLGPWPAWGKEDHHSRRHHLAIPDERSRSSLPGGRGRAGSGFVRGTPPQSKLVQRVFGTRGRRGRGDASRGKGRGRASARGGVSREGGEGGADSWALQAELQGKLRELEEEIARYKEENERVRLVRKKQETTLAEVTRKRNEVREWAEAERAAVEAWCTEQRQAAAREKRAALKQAQLTRARGQAGGGAAGGTATERRQRQEIEGLKATVEQTKQDAEALRKKARATERRLQQQIKAGAERVRELEGQVSFLEKQRVEVLASSSSANALGASQRGRAVVGIGAGAGAGAVGAVPFARIGSRRRTNVVSAEVPPVDTGVRKSNDGSAGLTKNPQSEAHGVLSGSLEQGEGRRSHALDEDVEQPQPEKVDDEERYLDRTVSFGDARQSSRRSVQDSGTVGKRDLDGAFNDDPGGPLSPRHRGSAGDVSMSRSNAYVEEEFDILQRHSGEFDPQVSRSTSSTGRQDESAPRTGPRHGAERPSGHLKRLGREHEMLARSSGDHWGECPEEIHEESHFEQDPMHSRLAAETVSVSVVNAKESAAPPDAEVDRLTAGGLVTVHDVDNNGKSGQMNVVGDMRSGQVVDGVDRDDALMSRGTQAYASANDEDPSWTNWNGSMSASEGLKHDNYDPRRYKTFSGSSSGSGSQDVGGRRRSANPDDATPSKGQWNGSTSNELTTAAGGSGGGTRSRSVNWADEDELNRSRREPPTRARARPSSFPPRDDAIDDPGNGLGGGSGPPILGGAELGDGVCGSTGTEHSGMCPVQAHVDKHAVGDDFPHEVQSYRRDGAPMDSDSADRSLRARVSAHGLQQSDTVGEVSICRSAIREPVETAGDRQTGFLGGWQGLVYDRGRPHESTAVVSAGRGAPMWSSSGGGSGKMEQVLPDGRKITLFANGTRKEILPNGGSIVRFMNGDVKRVEAGTGVVTYTYAEARTTHIMHPSGLEVFEFPNGQVERHRKSGEKEIDFPDGTRKTILPSGREISEFPDGVVVLEYPEGYRDVTSPDGTCHRELPDGTLENLPPGSGNFSRIAPRNT